MIIVDNALRERAREGRPVRVGLVGAGYSGRRIAYQISTAVPGMTVVGIVNRTLARAREAFEYAGVNDVVDVRDAGALDVAVSSGRRAVSADFRALTESAHVDVIVEATGTIEYGAHAVKSAIEHSKHVVLMNVELDATVGPLFKALADEKGVVYSNSDGDEPGVAMNMFRFVRSIGLQPVVAGNLKGLYDPYRNPDTQVGFAATWGQKPQTMAHFADGTKLSMELNVLANAAGFRVARRGMYGPKLTHVNESAAYFADKLVEGGTVDFLLGAAPGNGAFVIGHSTDPMRKDYLKYLKMGDGPLYVFYTPFHLPQLEIPNTIARAALLHDATVAPLGAPVCESIAIAKRDLRAGDVLDGVGGFTSYALLENYDVARDQNLLPMGVAEGCRLERDLAKDTPLRYEDVALPANRLVDQLRAQQEARFAVAATRRSSAA